MIGRIKFNKTASPTVLVLNLTESQLKALRSVVQFHLDNEMPDEGASLKDDPKFMGLVEIGNMIGVYMLEMGYEDHRDDPLYHAMLNDGIITAENGE